MSFLDALAKGFLSGALAFVGSGFNPFAGIAGFGLGAAGYLLNAKVSTEGQWLRLDLSTSASLQNALSVIYGQAKVGVKLIDVRVDGDSTDSKDLAIVAALCHGSQDGNDIESVREIWFDDRVVTDSAGTLDGAWYVGGTPIVSIAKHLGADDQATDTELASRFPAVWTAAHQGRGVAYLRFILTYDKDHFTNIPAITCIVRGAHVYDHRDTTWKWSDNPALCIRDYLLSTTYGLGASAGEIDETSFDAAATLCESLGYTCNGALDTARSVQDNLNALCTSCRGAVLYVGGKFQLVIRDVASQSGITLGHDEIVGDWDYELPGLSGAYNSVLCRFTNPARQYQTDEAEWPTRASNTYITDDNSFEHRLELELPFTNSWTVAQHLGSVLLKESRVGPLVAVTVKDLGIQFVVGDLTTVTHEDPGWTAKPFWIMGVGVNPDGTVRLLLAGYAESAYSPDSTVEPTVVGTTLPDPYTVAAPTSLTHSEGDPASILTADGVRLPRILLGWTRPANAFLAYYEIQAQLHGAGDWDPWGTASAEATSFYIGPLASVSWDVRIRAVNTLGFASAWAEVDGITPSVTGSSMAAVSFYFGAAGAPASGNPQYRWLVDGSSPPKGLLQGFDGSTTRTFFTADFGANSLTVTPAVSLSALLTLQAGVTVSGGAISASGIAATVGTLTATRTLASQGGVNNLPLYAMNQTGVNYHAIGTANAIEVLGIGQTLDQTSWAATPPVTINTSTGAVSMGTLTATEAVLNPASGGALLQFKSGGTSYSYIVGNSGSISFLDPTGNEQFSFVTTAGAAPWIKFLKTNTAYGYLAFSAVNTFSVLGNTGSAIWYSTASALYPATAGGLTLGTTAKPWKDPCFGYDASNRLDLAISSAGAVTYTAVGASAGHSFGAQAVGMGALGATTGTFSDATDATNSTTGPLKTAGGLAVAKSAFIGTTLTAPTLVGTTRITAPLFGTTSAADVVFDRNSVTQLTLGSLLATFAGDVTIGDLGRFDSGSTPDLDDVLRYNGTEWIPVALQYRFTDGDMVAEAFTDGTAAAYVHDGRSLSGTPSAPGSAPTISAGYKSITVDMSAISGGLGATEAWVIQWSDDAGSSWSDAGGDEIVTTGDKAVHTKLLIDGTQYRYRVRRRGGSDSAASSSTADLAPSSTPDITPATIVLASQIATVDLASISANIGVITAGAIRNVANTHGFLISGAMSSWGTWTRFVNLVDETDNFIEHERFKVHHDGTVIVSDGTNTLFTITSAGTSAYWQNTAGTAGVNVAGALPGGFTRYLNLNGSGAFLKHERGEWNYDGSVKMYRSSTALFSLSASAFYLQDDGGTQGVNIYGSIPGGWTGPYLNLNGSGTMLHHDKLELKYSGTPLAIFRGAIDITVAENAQTVQDFHILLRDPDVAHGMTTIVETDVLGAIGFKSATGGGLNLMGFSDDGTTPIQFIGHAGATTLTDPVFFFEAWKKNGTGRQAIASTEIMLELDNGDAGTAGRVLVLGNGAMRVGDGSVSVPGYAFDNDPDNGIYRIGTDNWGAAAGGNLVAEFTGSDKSTKFKGPVECADGAVGAPGLTFASDPDNGLYHIGTNHWGMTLAGIQIVDLTGTLFHITGYAKIDYELQMADTSAPGTPTGGGVLTSQSGAGHWIGTGGTDTTFGPAGPHCPKCGYDFWRLATRNDEWDAYLYECGWCGAVYRKGPASVLDRLTAAQRSELLEAA